MAQSLVESLVYPPPAKITWRSKLSDWWSERTPADKCVFTVTAVACVVGFDWAWHAAKNSGYQRIGVAAGMGMLCGIVSYLPMEYSKELGKKYWQKLEIFYRTVINRKQSREKDAVMVAHKYEYFDEGIFGKN